MIPAWFKRRFGEPLRRLLFPGLTLEKLVLTHPGGPGESPNFWWHGLEQESATDFFPAISEEAKTACAEIREAYRPLLAEFDINFEEFFWGSIKNEEAEALYQLVRERKPQIAYQIGAFVGYSALVIARALAQNGQGVLISIDPEIPHRTLLNPVEIARRAAQSQHLEDRIRFIKGWHSAPSGDYIGLGLKRAIPSIGLETLNALDGPVDLAFIDGDHSTACTMADFLLLKDYLGVGGVVVFHDAWSWPTVAQAIHIIWHDIHYLMRGTAAYFKLATRRGEDGLVALERIAEETYPTLQLRVLDAATAQPVSGAIIHLPELSFSVKTGDDGVGYCLAEIPPGVQVEISHPAYTSHQSLLKIGTHGDFATLDIALTHND